MHFRTGPRCNGDTRESGQTQEGQRFVEIFALRTKKRATAIDKCESTLKTVLSNDKKLLLRLVKVATHSDAYDKKARADSQSSQARYVEVEPVTELARQEPDKV